MATDSEEPLFADNLDDFLDEDDDIPPLPPPLSHEPTITRATPITASQVTQPTTTQDNGGTVGGRGRETETVLIVCVGF